MHFLDGLGDRKYGHNLGNVNYILLTYRYPFPNRKYLTVSKKYGFKTKEALSDEIKKLIKGKFEYEFENNQQVYCKDLESGDWFRRKYDHKGRLVSFKCTKRKSWDIEYDDNNQLISYEDSDGNWWDINHFPNTECPFMVNYLGGL